MGSYSDQSKFVYIEMPDFGLGVLQSRFSAKNLESLYKRYEQRYLLSKLTVTQFVNVIHVKGNFTIYLFIQSLLNFGIICLSLTVPNEYCYSNSVKCRYVYYPIM
jgi:hypothetical protein